MTIGIVRVTSFRCLRGRRGACGDDVRLEAQAFGGEGGKSFATPVSGQVVDADGLPVHIAEIAQGLEERFKSRRPQCTRIKRKEAEPRDVPGLLGLRRKRPRDCRTANERRVVAWAPFLRPGAVRYHILE